MYIFVIVFLVLLIFAVLTEAAHTNLFVYFSTFTLIILAGFRNVNAYINNDTAMYYSIYNGFNDRKLEYGYTFLSNIFHFMRINWTYFALFIAFGTLIILTKEYIIFTNMPAFALLYYYARFFVSRDMNQIRASLAAAILLISIRYIYKGDFWRFLVIIMFATLFHTAGAIGIILYPVFKLVKKIDPQKYLRYFVVAITVALSLSFVTGLVFTKFNTFFTSVYITNTFYVKGGGLENPVLWMQIIISFFAIYLFQKGQYRNTKYYSVILYMYVISTIILALLSQYYTLAARTSTLFATVEPIILLNMCEIKFNKKVGLLIFVIIAVIIFYLINSKVATSDLIVF